MVNVSPRSVASAKSVLEDTAPEVVHAVDQGQLAVSAAEKLVALPKAYEPMVDHVIHKRCLTTRKPVVAKPVTQVLPNP